VGSHEKGEKYKIGLIIEHHGALSTRERQNREVTGTNKLVSGKN
jgi:hypothetical protein